MTCRDVADFILDYSTGELSNEVRGIFERHSSVCPKCREYLAQYLITVQLGRHAFDDTAPAVESGIPEELVVAILASRPR